MSNQKTEIKKIVVHDKPHADDLFGAYLFHKYGGAKWPGVETANIITKDGSVKMQKRTNWLIIGTGKGEFDEHGKEKKDLCAADLVARALEIEKQPKTSKLLKNIRAGDKAHGFPLDLTYCVNLLNFVGWNPNKIEKWLATFLDYYFDDARVCLRPPNKNILPKADIVYPIADPKIRKLFTENILLTQWLKETDKTAKDSSIANLLRQLTTLSKQPPSLTFNVIECACLIAVCDPAGAEAAYNWIKPIFDAEAEYQAEFEKAKEIIEPLETTVIKPFKDCKPYQIIQILAIDRTLNTKNNRRFTSAARYLKQNLDLIIIQSPSGNIQILDLRQKKLYLLPIIVRAIRLEEQIINGVSIDELETDYDLLAEPESVDCSPKWYCPANEGVIWAIFNGAFTQSGVEPTRILFDEIEKIVCEMVLWQNNEKSWYAYVEKRLKRLRHERDHQENGNTINNIARFTNGNKQ